MKRIMLVATGLLLGGSAAAQTIPVSVGGNASSLVGVNFELPIEVDLAARPDLLGSVALRLTWDAAVLSFVTGQDGAFGEMVANTDSLAAGILRIAGTNPGGTGGRFVLVRLMFRPVVADTTTIGLAVSEFYAAGTFADLIGSVVASGRGYCPARGRWGDLDGDGAANSRDALIALSAAVGLPIGGFDAGLGGVDADGATQARDALIILSYAVGLNVSGFRLATIASGACGVPVAALAIDPSSLTLLRGQDVRLAALAADGGGAAIAVNDVFWRSSNPGVATVGPSGLLLALDTGSTTVSVVRSGGVDTAYAPVTVVAARGTHWVSALARGARNRLGSSALPFGTIQEAVDFARPGDTVRVLPGRYAEALTVGRPVVIWGDTAGGAAAPLVGDPAGEQAAIRLQAPGRTELHNLRVDSTRVGIDVAGADSVVLRNLLYRGPYFGEDGVRVQSADWVRVEQVRLFGAADNYYASDGISYGGPGGVLVVDSSEISAFGSRGIAFGNGDSLDVRNSRITNNGDNGIYGSATDSTRAYVAVLSRNHLSGSVYGQVGFDAPRRVMMDHNVLVGGGYYYDLLYWSGYRQSVVSLRGDSLLVRGGGDWINGSYYDSLTVDSVYVEARDSYSYLWGGRATVIRNSRITDVTYRGLDFDGYYGGDGDSVTFVVENTVIEGPAQSECDRCGDGLNIDYANATLTDVVFRNLDQAVYAYDSTLTLRRAFLDHVWYGAYQYCGSLVVDSATVLAGYQAIYATGCGPQDSLRVDSVRVDGGDAAITGYGVRSVIRGTAISNVAYGIYLTSSPGYAVQTEVRNAVLTGIRSEGIVADPNDSLSTLVISDNLVACAPGTSADGIEAYNARDITVERNTVTNCAYGIRVQPSSGSLPAVVPVRIAGNRVVAPVAGGTQAIYFYSTRAHGDLWSDTAEGGGPGPAIQVDGAGWYARVDSNVVRNVGGTGIYVSAADSIYVRNNDIVDTVTAPCCGYHAAIVHVGGASTNVLAQITDNRIRGTASHGIYLRGSSTLDTARVLVARNVIRGVDSIGIYVREYSRSDIQFNTVDSAGQEGIYVERYDADTTSVHVNNNNITASGRYGLLQVDGWALDATSNWWGDALGPSGAFGDTTLTSLGDSVSVNVVWDPWLIAPEPGAPLTAPPVFLSAPRTAGWTAPATGAAADADQRRPGVHARPAPAVRQVKPAPPGQPEVDRTRRQESDRRRAERRPHDDTRGGGS